MGTTIKYTGCNCSIIEILKLTNRVHHFRGDVIEYGTFTIVFGFVFYKKYFFTIVSVPYLLTYSQLLDPKLDIIIIIDSQVRFALPHFLQLHFYLV